MVSPSEVYNQITWNKGPGTPTAYKIFRDIDLTNLVATVPAGTTQYLDLHPTIGQTYWYYLEAMYADGFSSTIGSVIVDPHRVCQH